MEISGGSVRVLIHVSAAATTLIHAVFAGGALICAFCQEANCREIVTEGSVKMDASLFTFFERSCQHKIFADVVASDDELFVGNDFEATEFESLG